ncbi:Cadherin-87A [Eumeta japonica]|uniref:Cadherin-87A n=1 Tax=Eumeta variegata TaxID=151549 RepID=A0A4C1WMD9_EUMVA|nr:Cadherin-87A [Eumeta japonica]
MPRRWQVAFAFWAVLAAAAGETNLPPAFVEDMDNLPLSESTPLGEVVYALKGRDPEGQPIKYGLVGTDRFSVNADTGEITLVKPLDREVNDTMKFLVSIEDQVPGGQNNLVRVPFTIIVLDENDNAPYFKNSPYEVDVPEDAAAGTTVLRDIAVEDKDSVGDNLEVGCADSPQWADACDTFEVVAVVSSADQFRGALVLRKSLNYNDKQFYQFKLYASDGRQNSTAHVEVKIEDIQNSPPVFSGSMAAALAEDAPVGSLVTTIRARDADRAHPRAIHYDLITNPLDFFVLDSSTGELKTAKPLDREALADPSSPLNLTIRAREIVNGQPITSELTMATATLSVTIKDVNDEPPRFNRPEYSVEIPESLPVGTPIPNLDMMVMDTDLGLNAVFGLRLSDEWGAFVVEPTKAAGSAAVTLRLNDTLDYEDPNRRKFILVVIAEELHTNPRLSSKAIVTVVVTDVNDNAPKFTEEVYSAVILEDATPGTRVATITATDRDQGRHGSDGIVYQLSGNGAELFRLDNRTGDVSVAPCPTPGRAPCLDIETRRDYLLHYKATDDDGTGQTTVVSLQVTLLDANDNPPACATAAYRAAIDEDATKFEPELQA